MTAERDRRTQQPDCSHERPYRESSSTRVPEFDDACDEPSADGTPVEPDDADSTPRRWPITAVSSTAAGAYICLKLINDDATTENTTMSDDYNPDELPRTDGLELALLSEAENAEDYRDLWGRILDNEVFQRLDRKLTGGEGELDVASVRADEAVIGSSKLYIQDTEPADATEGDVWIDTS